MTEISPLQINLVRYVDVLVQRAHLLAEYGKPLVKLAPNEAKIYVSEAESCMIIAKEIADLIKAYGVKIDGSESG